MTNPQIHIINGRQILSVDMGPARLWHYESYVEGSTGEVMRKYWQIEPPEFVEEETDVAKD